MIGKKLKTPSARRLRTPYPTMETAARGARSSGRPAADPRLFETPEAKRIKKEICAVGRKLWLRQFVDGNGGNISYRIGPNEAICTPTMLSKFDLRPRDLCMVDLDGNQIAGTLRATSEILLHLEIYKAVPEAKAAVHCHPPHATAYAITGITPPTGLIPEYEIFIGKVAVAPYETPGTQAFAETVLPFVREHNAILLGNHGVVTWADTPTLAEWHCEILETYCATLAHARQLHAPLGYIAGEKRKDLVARRKLTGFPDQRPDRSANRRPDQSPGRRPTRATGGKGGGARLSESEIEALVRRIAREVVQEIGENGEIGERGGVKRGG